MSKKAKKVKGADFGGFILANAEKLDRVINGVVGPGGKLVGGLGKDAPTEAILAEYDRLAGLVLTQDGERVATGSFYDFESQEARKQPLVKLAKNPNTTGQPQITTKEHTEGREDKPVRRVRRKKVEEEEAEAEDSEDSEESEEDAEE